MPLFLAIDGGGSKTTCLVADEERTLASASAEGSNPIRVGEARARRSLHDAIREACACAQVAPRTIERTCVGMAGAGRPEIAAPVAEMVREIAGGAVEVLGDMVIALEAAFHGGPGLVVIAGTGSIAYGRNTRGETARAGGWGFAISDEGSGHWIGREAVAAAMRAHDGGENTTLISSIMNTWHLGCREDVVRAANALPPPDFAGLFSVVLDGAAAGDAKAREILTSAGTVLAQLGALVVDRLWQGAAGVRVALAGGVFQNSPLVRQVFANSLRSRYASLNVATGVVEPVEGALWRARNGSAPQHREKTAGHPGTGK